MTTKNSLPYIKTRVIAVEKAIRGAARLLAVAFGAIFRSTAHKKLY